MSQLTTRSLHAERLGEAEEAVHHVLAPARGDARVGEQPLQLARPRPVEPELHAWPAPRGRRGSPGRRAACGAARRTAVPRAARRNSRRAPRPARLSTMINSTPSIRLMRRASVLPMIHVNCVSGQARCKRAQERHDVAGIADRRQPQQADAARRLGQRQHQRSAPMSRQWPLGSEVKRKDLTGGAMLYDASRAGNAAPGWFDACVLAGARRARGRGAGPRHRAFHPQRRARRCVLRHYRRGGLVARVVARSLPLARRARDARVSRVAASLSPASCRACRCRRRWRRAISGTGCTTRRISSPSG